MNKVKNLTKIMFANLILLLFFAGCDKYHRNRYVGDWDFVTLKAICIYDDFGELMEIKRDTVFYSGNIKCGDEYENELIIQYTVTDVLHASIEYNANNEARLIGGPSLMGGHSSTGSAPFIGGFDNNNQVHFNLSWKEQDKSNNYVSWSITGKKIERRKK